MLLYMIRHGQPDYSTDTLTDEGKRQAEALVARWGNRPFDAIYASPLGRAQQTAMPTCRHFGMDYEIEEWMNENLAYLDFFSESPDGYRGWAFFGQTSEMKNASALSHGDDWENIGAFKNAPAAGDCYRRIAEGADGFLARLGYVREGKIYKIAEANERRIAVFAHQGIGMIMLSHLLGISPNLFLSSFDISFTGVTVLDFKNYENGYTAPRCLMLSDISHLAAAGISTKYHGYITL